MIAIRVSRFDDLKCPVYILEKICNLKKNPQIKTINTLSSHFVDQCGVDIDNGGSNGGGNISSVLVWPWMAAVHINTTSGTQVS